MSYFSFFTVIILALNFYQANAASVNSYNGKFRYVEGNVFEGEVQSKFGVVDNFFSSHDNPQASNFFEVSPSVFLQAQFDENLLQISAKSQYVKFSDFSQDDHNDISLLSKYHLKLAQSQKLFVTSAYKESYEYRGQGLSLGDGQALEEGDNKEQYFINAGYLYGHEKSVARAKILVGHRSFAYQTRREQTRKLDLTGDYLQGSFDYLISGKSYLTSKLQYEKINYSDNDALTRKQYSALLGLKWQSTYATEVKLLFGYEKALFADSDLSDETSFVWQGNLTWRPLERLSISALTGRNIQDSNKLDNSISVVDSYAFNINYAFTERVSLYTNTKIANKSITSSSTVIDEDTLSTGIGSKYQWRDWLAVSVDYHYNDLASSQPNHSYDTNRYSLNLTLTI